MEAAFLNILLPSGKFWKAQKSPTTMQTVQIFFKINYFQQKNQ